MGEKDAIKWIPIIHTIFSSTSTSNNSFHHKIKLKKVLSTWKDLNIFPQSSIKEMYTCFDKDDIEQAMAVAKVKQAENVCSNLSSQVKIEMQNLLNELYQNENELDKLSLERLAVVNRALFDQIKDTAEQQMLIKNKNIQNTTTTNQNQINNNNTKQSQQQQD